MQHLLLAFLFYMGLNLTLCFCMEDDYKSEHGEFKTKKERREYWKDWWFTFFFGGICILYIFGKEYLAERRRLKNLPEE